MKVIIVEDDEVIRSLIADALREVGYEVSAETSGEAALDFIATSEPVAMVIDVHLAGGMSGYDYVKAVRSRWPSVGVVYVSGNRGNLAGRPIAPNERFLPKPFLHTDLIAAVNTVAACSRPRPRA